MLQQDIRPSTAISKIRASKRAAVACTACSLRKVRCTVALSGPPCANCAVDYTPCEISRRKRRRNLDLQPSLAHANGNEEASSAAPTSSSSRAPIALPPATSASPRHSRLLAPCYSRVAFKRWSTTMLFNTGIPTCVGKLRCRRRKFGICGDARRWQWQQGKRHSVLCWRPTWSGFRNGYLWTRKILDE
ncbi:hypothetical protein HYQ44_009423 [Verticillium longisporum]|nr:hypothetical protein HYQ44_009423 [Verticillium longisporum]